MYILTNGVYSFLEKKIVTCEMLLFMSKLYKKIDHFIMQSFATKYYGKDLDKLESGYKLTSVMHSFWEGFMVH